MKAIKLASVFAVSAVAAAISTTTLAAAEPVFKGTAGINFSFGDESGANRDGDDQSAEKYGSEGEVNVIADTGLVYFDMDMSSNRLVLDEAYVKQGAVSFGDFDGSLSDSAVMYGGVEEGDDASTDLGITLGVRYAVTDSLTVALEAVEGEKTGYLAAAYSHDFGAAKLVVSGAFADTEETTSTLAAGLSVPMGMATLQGYVQSGKDNGDKLASMGVGVDLAVTEALMLSVAHYDDTESDADDATTEATVNFTQGDIRYYVTYLVNDADESNWGYAGVEASF